MWIWGWEERAAVWANGYTDGRCLQHRFWHRLIGVETEGFREEKKALDPPPGAI